MLASSIIKPLFSHGKQLERVFLTTKQQSHIVKKVPSQKNAIRPGIADYPLPGRMAFKSDADNNPLTGC
jgi:hypothetical protein